jgi:opacity protein-like surface antigen
MKTIVRATITAAIMFFVSVPFVTAQDDRHQGEFFGGFMHQRGEEARVNGINVAGTYNFHTYMGIKGDFSWGTKDNFSITNYMGGLQFKDNSKSDSMIKPFAHVLMGAQRWKADFSGMSTLGIDAPAGILVFPDEITETGFSMAFGGGIDIKVSDRVSVRAFQYDYNPVWLEGGRVNTNRFSFGIVIH